MKKLISALVALSLSLLVTSFTSSNENPSGFIVNGRDADISEFPHHLGLFDQGRFFCGASVLSPQFALSAAHCLEFGTHPDLIHLWGGSTSRIAGGHLFFISQYYLHPEYRTIRLTTGQAIWDYDTAILRMHPGTPLEGFPHVLPTILPPPCFEECCGVCGEVQIRMAGWGLLANGTLPVNLQQVEQYVVPYSECRTYWEGHITSRMFCVTSYFYDSCNGDSGSAIMLEQPQQVGYVSFGAINCGDGSAPAVYGRLEEPSIRNWITSVTGL